MERKIKWLHVALVVLKALVAALAGLSADQVLTGGRLSDALGPPLALGAQLPHDKQGLLLRSSSSHQYALAKL